MNDRMPPVPGPGPPDGEMVLLRAMEVCKGTVPFGAPWGSPGRLALGFRSTQMIPPFTPPLSAARSLLLHNGYHLGLALRFCLRVYHFSPLTRRKNFCLFCGLPGPPLPITSTEDARKYLHERERGSVNRSKKPSKAPFPVILLEAKGFLPHPASFPTCQPLLPSLPH